MRWAFLKFDLAFQVWTKILGIPGFSPNLSGNFVIFLSFRIWPEFVSQF